MPPFTTVELMHLKWGVDAPLAVGFRPFLSPAVSESGQERSPRVLRGRGERDHVGTY